MSSTLNLARKWRPKNFNQIAGQQIPVSILQNSLFSQKLFPVYLFAGQRGCGKTSTARIFGAAINCKNLSKFQSDAQNNKIPCLECESCKAMLKGNHPDFIEIDAASHTGVENVRQILEVCSYLPILGSKKIYLIDEAHMLSKAAFNAFLKVLEEPPVSALFILATTEIQKFPETVLSRCFQIIFKAVENTDLERHLQKICDDEKIEIEPQAIKIIIQETQGSVRDAINLLERVRFSEKKITVDSLLKVLGKISETELFNIFECLLEKKPTSLLNTLSSQTFQTIDPQTFWNSLLQLFRSLIWIKFKAEKLPTYFNNITKLLELAKKCSTNRLNAILQLLWTQEELFLKTPQKKVLLETVLLQICQQTNIADLKDILNQNDLNVDKQKHIQKIEPKQKAQINITPNTNLNTNSPQSTSEQRQPEQPPKPQIANIAQEATNTNPVNLAQNNIWNRFLKKVEVLQDPVLMSIFSQSKLIDINAKEKKVKIALKHNSSFFKDKITDCQKIWLQPFKEIFPNCDGFSFIAQNTIQSEKKYPHTIQRNSFTPKQPVARPFTPKSTGYTTLNLSDKAKWPKANLLLKYFPGKIRLNNNKN